MSTGAHSERFRTATIGDLADGLSRALRRALWPTTAALTAFCGYLLLTGSIGAGPFALMSAGTIIVLAVWASGGEGLPVVPLLAVQNLAVYGLPILVNNTSIMRYTGAQLTHAGWEVLTNDLAMIIAWRGAMAVLPTGSNYSYALQALRGAPDKIARIGLGLIIAATAHDALLSAKLLDPVLVLLPTGSESILHVLVAAMSECGFFLVGMIVGQGRATHIQTIIFWAMLIISCLLSAAGFLLSACITVLLSAIIGLLWGSGRIPWRLLMIAGLILGFLNLGKFAMRGKYWHLNDGDDPQPQITLTDMPQTYTEWVGASTDALLGNSISVPDTDDMAAADDKQVTKQSLLGRINNLQSLLFVIDAMSTNHLAPLGGATYSLIPPLLVPRVLWPNKPRTHEGQILLNVYFGRQDLNATYETYIAWGLLPEAYGNFGPIMGSVVLGLTLGIVFAAVEKFTARKLMLSVEGFVSFALFLGIANAYEMVASVLVTSVFQSFIPIVAACAPFVQRTKPHRVRVVSADAT